MLYHGGFGGARQRGEASAEEREERHRGRRDAGGGKERRERRWWWCWWLRGKRGNSMVVIVREEKWRVLCGRRREKRSEVIDILLHQNLPKTETCQLKRNCTKEYMSTNMKQRKYSANNRHKVEELMIHNQQRILYCNNYGIGY